MDPEKPLLFWVMFELLELKTRLQKELKGGKQTEKQWQKCCFIIWATPPPHRAHIPLTIFGGRQFPMLSFLLKFGGFRLPMSIYHPPRFGQNLSHHTRVLVPGLLHAYLLLAGGLSIGTAFMQTLRETVWDGHACLMDCLAPGRIDRIRLLAALALMVMSGPSPARPSDLPPTKPGLLCAQEAISTKRRKKIGLSVAYNPEVPFCHKH